MSKLTHVDKNGKAAMVDISEKKKTVRSAEASAVIYVSSKLFRLIIKNKIAKGDVLTVAKIAGIQAAKRTFELIPLCHNISLSSVDIKIIPHEKSNSLEVFCTVSAEDKTGVEMEALTGASIAALTIYDMCKAVEKSILISEIKLLSKSGGKSGTYKRK